MEEQHIFGNEYRAVINQIAIAEKKHVEETSKLETYHQQVFNNINSEHEQINAKTIADHEQKILSLANDNKNHLNSYEQDQRHQESQATELRKSKLNTARSNKESQSAQLKSKIADIKTEAANFSISVDQNNTSAEEYLHKLEGLAKITPTSKVLDKLNLTGHSLDSMKRILSDAARLSEEYKQIINQTVNEFIEVHANNAKLRTIAAVLSFVIILIVSLDVFTVFNQRTLREGYNLAAKNLEDGHFDLVVDQIESLNGKLKFRKNMMPLFLGESTFVRLIGKVDVQYPYIPAIEYYLMQREALYQKGMSAYKSRKWSESNAYFERILYDDVSFTNTYNNKGSILWLSSELNDYRKKRNLPKGFNTIKVYIRHVNKT